MVLNRRWGSCGHDSSVKDPSKKYFFVGRLTDTDIDVLIETKQAIKDELGDTPSNPVLLRFLMDYYLDIGDTDGIGGIGGTDGTIDAGGKRK
jgi:hypothetical protein